MPPVKPATAFLKPALIGAFVYSGYKVLSSIFSWFPVAGVEVVNFLLWGAAIVIGGMWYARLGRNADSLNRGDRTWSTGLGVAMLYIPIVNLVTPYFVTRELYRSTAPDEDWKVSEVPGYLNLWWGLWAAAGAIFWVAFFWGLSVSVGAGLDAGSAPELQQQEAEKALAAIDPILDTLTTVSAAIVLGALPLYMRLCREIAERQDALIAKSNS